MKALFVKNEKGGMAALLSVIILSAIMVISLTAIYSYLENQTRYQAFVKANNQMGFVMQDLAQTTLQAYQQQVTNPGCGGGGSVPKYLDCTLVCMPPVAVAYPGANLGGNPTYALCVTNNTLNQTNNNSKYFCTYNTDTAGTSAVGDTVADIPGYCAGIPVAENFHPGLIAPVAYHPRGNKLEKWYARLDQFFDTTIHHVPEANARLAAIMGVPQIQPPTMWGWLLPETAYAQTSYPSQLPSGGQTTSGQTTTIIQPAHPLYITMGSINCSNAAGAANAISATNSCQKCGAAQRNNGSCFDLAVCPPWMNNETCFGQSNTAGKPGNNRPQDPRYHQVITLNQ